VNDCDPKDKKVPTKKQFYKDGGIYPMTFTPKREGLHELNPLYKGKNIFDSPINIIVDSPENGKKINKNKHRYQIKQKYLFQKVVV
jgi:hypothetical protein